MAFCPFGSSHDERHCVVRSDWDTGVKHYRLWWWRWKHTNRVLGARGTGSASMEWRRTRERGKTPARGDGTSQPRSDTAKCASPATSAARQRRCGNTAGMRWARRSDGRLACSRYGVNDTLASCATWRTSQPSALLPQCGLSTCNASPR